jgi:WD40 repeat protein
MEVFGLSSDRAFNWTIESTREARFNQLPDRALAAAQNGKHLAVVTPEAVLLYEDFAPTKPFTAKPVRSFTGRFRGGQSVALSAKGTLLAYTDEQNWITIVSTATGTTKNSLLLPSNVLGLAFTPDGEKVVAVGRDGFLRLFSCDTQSGMKSDLWKARVQRAPKAAVAVSPDGRLIAATSATEVLVVTATDGKTAFALGRVHLDDGPFHLVAFSPDGRLLVTGSRGMTGAIQVWEVATRTLVRRFVTHSGAVQTFDVSTDGSRIVSAGAEEAITLWDLSFRKGKSTPSHEELMAAWNELDSPEGEKGYAALRVLVAGGKKGVEVLENGINVSEIVRREKRVAQWVKDLSSEDETTRERASKSLLEAGVRARAALEVVEATTSSDEIRLRASKIIEKLSERSIFVPDHGLVGDTLRLVRAVQVLEDVGGSESQRLLGEIATMGGRPGEDAAAALKRMRPR